MSARFCPPTSANRAEFADANELYALGLPMELIASETGVKRSRLEWWFNSSGKVRRPERHAALRAARISRIQSNIAAYPSQSYCFPE